MAGLALRSRRRCCRSAHVCEVNRGLRDSQLTQLPHSERAWCLYGWRQCTCSALEAAFHGQLKAEYHPCSKAAALRTPVPLHCPSSKCAAPIGCEALTG